MKHSSWILLGVVGLVLVVGFMYVNSASFKKLGTGTSTQSTLGSVASIFKSTGTIFNDVEKAFPSWFNAGDTTPTDANLNNYASSSGFASTPDVSS